MTLNLILEKVSGASANTQRLRRISFDGTNKIFLFKLAVSLLLISEKALIKDIEGFVGYTKTGIFFGVVIKELDYLCVKTYVSANMLFDNQVESLVALMS